MSVELSVTKKIKRRVIDIVPNPTQELSECSVTVVNWFQNKDNERTKFKISNFVLENSSIPCFIPKHISSFPDASVLSNKHPAGELPLPINTFTDNSPSPNVLDYYVNIHKPGTPDENNAIRISMDPSYSEYPQNQPLSYITNEDNFVSNRYYWFFNTSKFCELVAKHINQVAGEGYCDIIRTNDAYGLYMNKQFSDDGYFLQFSQNLIDLFQFRSCESINSTELRTIVFNTQLRTYNNVPSLFVVSNYIPSTWFPFDAILFNCNGPFEPVTYYDNRSFISSNYQNIILNFQITNDNPDGIYNFFVPDSTIRDPSANWVSLIGSNSGENITFNILLRLRSTGTTIPYTIKRNEKASFVTEEVSFF